jgi:ASC-1-like (ASCH) protein
MKSNLSASDELAKLLDAKEPLFSKSIKGLEESSSKEDVEEALYTEISNRFSDFTKNVLKLKSVTDGKSIYKSLMNLIEDQNELILTKYFKLNESAGIDEILSACISFAAKMDLPKKVFRIKKNKARKMLLNNPPVKIMELLDYKSAKELLKNERLEEVYGALRFAEGEEWLNKFNEQYKNLRPKDFTEAEIEVIKMPLKWAPLTKDFIKKKKHNITHLKELGVLLILETEDESLKKGLALKVLPLIVHYYYEIHLYSAFFKLKAKTEKRRSFGRVIKDTIIADPKLKLQVKGSNVHWRVVQRYFGKLDDAKKHPEIFEPHLQPEDLHWDLAEKALAKYIPELEIWKDLDFVAIEKDSLPLSLNLMDLTLSYANSLDYKDRLYYHFRESLWNEIFARYMGVEVLENELLTKLNNALVYPERL